MKVVAYSINPFEKEFLIRANQKKHDITLISNALSVETAAYAEGKDAVLVFTNDDVSELVINKLANLGVKFIATRSKGTDHINKKAAEKRGIKLANVPTYSPRASAGPCRARKHRADVMVGRSLNSVGPTRPAFWLGANFHTRAHTHACDCRRTSRSDEERSVARRAHQDLD